MTSEPRRIAITEEQLAGEVEDLLNIFQWRWCHFRPARTEHGWRTAVSGYKGFPDYIAARLPRLIIFELKSEKGKLTPEQAEWLELLRNCTSIEAYCWRPNRIDKIAEILRWDCSGIA